MWSTLYERIWRDCQPRGGGSSIAQAGASDTGKMVSGAGCL